MHLDDRVHVLGLQERWPGRRIIVQLRKREEGEKGQGKRVGREGERAARQPGPSASLQPTTPNTHTEPESGNTLPRSNYAHASHASRLTHRNLTVETSENSLAVLHKDRQVLRCPTRRHGEKQETQNRTERTYEEALE
jgi:hypothetical protein